MNLKIDDRKTRRPMLGKRHTEEAKRKMSISHQGMKDSEETRRKKSLSARRKKPWLMGKYPSKETREKISEANSGDKHWNWKGGISNKMKKAGRAKPENCELCGLKGKICFDHDHRTGKFRGWICVNCNSALGFVNDDIRILNLMIKYLERA